MYLLLAASLLLNPSFYEPDPSLQEVGDAYAEFLRQEAERQAEETAPTLMWRIAGWVNYVACGSVTLSNEYRASRSDWTPTINNEFANAAAMGGGAYGANELTDWIRQSKGNQKGAWIGRAALGTGCLIRALYNFNRGFFRE